MVIKKDTIQRIREIIEKHHNALAISVVGKNYLSPSRLKELQAQGIDISNEEAVLEAAYYHNWLNPYNSQIKPLTYSEMKNQQQLHALPIGEAHDISIEHLNSNMAQLIDSQKAAVASRIEGFIRDNNNKYKMDALQNLDRHPNIDQMVKEQTIPQLKRNLRDYTGTASKNWDRIVNTEVSNAVGLGSTDRIVGENKEKDLGEIYVYRIVIRDGSLCKFCRKFFLDSDGTPKVYKLSTLLNNGSNYGKKADQWLPTTMVTHPNERCSQIIELKPGWAVKSGGSQTFIGHDAWRDYILNKVSK